ncbi:ABC transporter substrate-binding protein [Treponema brennaborense]|uniref:Extracellular solute-binding protein family 1 n=1 Tax=Treponema brennaborense (strain DSM 12168 / CIP 105900 / DD5/3) TaxID=906968 RepID=F4LNL2_TREBD|nr:ABC transporter substrate-binding protein [Treponema brennaborense]AEE15866.1 extracellular solute-binding protein family 1 [Treponema brennaborense DSM 12168]
MRKSVKLAIAVAVTASVVFASAFAGGKMENSSAAKSTGADKTIRVFGAFRGEEAARFDEIIKIFNAKTGYNVVYEGSPEFETQILVQAEAGTPPDIAALPQPGMMKNFASRGFIKPLSANVVSKIDENYAKVWKELGTADDGRVYGVFHRVNAKSFVWYPKKAWEAKGYRVPQTWDELLSLQKRMIANGDTPWSIGFESGAATGWVGTDWLEDIMLRTAGPEVYDKWVNHEIPFNDPAVRTALRYMGDIMLDSRNVYGGTTYILTSNFGDSVKPLFDTPPKAYMNRQGNFITGFMPERVQAQLEEEVGVFAFPAINPEWGTPVLGGGDQFVAFNDRPEVQEFLAFLTTWESCAPWAKIGGALFPHKTQNFDDYGNAIERDIAKILVNASVFRFDGSDLMPAEVGAGTFWTGMVDFISGRKAETVLSDIEKSWPEN